MFFGITIILYYCTRCSYRRRYIMFVRRHLPERRHAGSGEGQEQANGEKTQQ